MRCVSHLLFAKLSNNVECLEKEQIYVLPNNLYCELSVLCNAISTKYWAKFRIAGTSRKGIETKLKFGQKQIRSIKLKLIATICHISNHCGRLSVHECVFSVASYRKASPLAIYWPCYGPRPYIFSSTVFSKVLKIFTQVKVKSNSSIFT